MSFVVLACAFVAAAWLVPGVEVHGGVRGLVWTTSLFASVNVVLGGVARSSRVRWWC
ncbi:hypothetical protein ACU686_16090 [Yinghuangia aomiensis]